MIKFFKIRKKPYVGVVFVYRNFYKKLWLSRTGVVPQHLDVKVTEQTGSQTKIIPSLSACKDHSINLLNSSNHL